MTATLVHQQISGAWVDALIAQSKRWDTSDTPESNIDPIWVPEHRKQALVASGYIPYHTDDDCEQWAYILILKTTDAVLEVVGYTPLPLTPGMVVEFNAHRQHRLRQPARQTMIWLPFDSQERLPIENAIQRIKKEWTVPG